MVSRHGVVGRPINWLSMPEASNNAPSPARASLPTTIAHVEYSLTPLGIETARRAEDLVEWIQINLVEMLPNADMLSPGVDS